MDAYACDLRAVVHLVMKERLGCRNEPVEVAQTRDALHEVDDLIDEEARHHDGSHRFGRLGRSDHVFAVHALVALGHGQPIAFEIEI